MILCLIFLVFALNKNFAHLDDAMKEKMVNQNIIKKDPTTEDEHLVWFSTYDRDENLKLDGHEVLFGILNEDVIDEVKEGNFYDYSKSEYFNDPKSLYDQVDNIMDDFDVDGDGYITYSEYLLGMKGDE